MRHTSSIHSTSRNKSRASHAVVPVSESERGLGDVEQPSQAARSLSSSHRENDRAEDQHLDPEVNEEKEKEDEKFALDNSILGIEPYSNGSQGDPAGARAVLDFGPEGCSCFPSRSSRTVPSMLYDQVHCLHCHVTGHAHVGVFQFDDNWDANVKTVSNVKSTDRHPPTKKYVSGYPNFQLSEFQEDDHNPVKERARNTATEKSRDGQRELRGQTDLQGKGHKETISFDDEGDRSLPQSTKVLLTSSAVSRCALSPATTVKTSSLLKMEDQALSTAHEKKATVGSQSSLVETYSRKTTPAGKFVSRSRTFRGQFYDAATDECYIFEITPDFGRELDQWNAHKELTRQRTHGTKKTKGDNY